MVEETRGEPRVLMHVFNPGRNRQISWVRGQLELPKEILSQKKKQQKDTWSPLLFLVFYLPGVAALTAVMYVFLDSVVD